jgi:hypothetical protein
VFEFGLVSARSQVDGDIAHNTANVARLEFGSTLSLLGALRLLGGLLAGTTLLFVGVGAIVVVVGRLVLNGSGGFRFVTAVVVNGSRGSGELGDGGARELVLELAVEGLHIHISINRSLKPTIKKKTYINQNSLVVVRVSSWEADKLIGRRSTLSVTSNLELSARRVKLGTLWLVGEVQRDQLVHDDVVSGGKVGGNLCRTGLAGN